jgi:hypothetical protein
VSNQIRHFPASQRGNQRVSKCKGKAYFAFAERELIGDRKGLNSAKVRDSTNLLITTARQKDTP